MKKLIITTVVLATIILSTLSVSATEVDTDFVSHMDLDTYLSIRTEQIQNAYDNQLITEAEYNELLAHIQEVALEGTFGSGPSFGIKGDGNAVCILGEDSTLGIFRSESAGMRTGSGNGVSIQSQDGLGIGNGNKGQVRGGGRGLAGQRNLEDCLLVD
ncbi:MAG: hypothetical protein PF505_11475 [Vallitaleaceae bacterium]|nr:hypothetical protein [Vallitaleaceae bacterium]